MEDIKTAVILAGGRGTRFSEYTKTIPKPMIEAKGKPLLIHIINIYKLQGISNFYILTGYKSEVIENYFRSIFNETSENKFEISEDVFVNILNTGIETMTGGRVKQVINYIDEDLFFLTYGDGVSNINLKNLYDFHFEKETIATLTAVRPPARFGSLELNSENFVESFGEKNNAKEGWINGGFFILNKKISNYIENDSTLLEQGPLQKLSSENQLKAYQHSGFWRPVDTIRELEILEKEMEQNLFKYYQEK